MHSPTSSISSLLVVATLVLSACSGSSDASVSRSDASASESTDAPSTDSPVTTETTTTETTTTETTTTEAIVDVDAYCDATRIQDSVSDDFDDVTDPVALESFFVDSLERTDERIAVAADEIRGSLEELRVFQQDVNDVFVAHDWDYAASLDEIEVLQADTDRTALDQLVDDYDFETCGIDDDDEQGTDGEETGEAAGVDPSESPSVEEIQTLLDTETGRQLFIDQTVADGLTLEQATCFIDEGFFIQFYEIGIGGAIDDAAATSLFVDVIDTCDLPIDYFD